MGVTEEYLYHIRLNLASQFKYSLSLQVPFLYVTHIYNLTQKPISELALKYTVSRIKVDDNLVFNVERSKFLRHKIHVKNKKTKLTFHVLERGMVDEYENILSRVINMYKE